MDVRETWCPSCLDVCGFEVPACLEHGADCPELACTMCGWALIGPDVLPLATVRRPLPARV